VEIAVAIKFGLCKSMHWVTLRKLQELFCPLRNAEKEHLQNAEKGKKEPSNTIYLDEVTDVLHLNDVLTGVSSFDPRKSEIFELVILAD
jgi:hypothetical protein